MTNPEDRPAVRWDPRDTDPLTVVEPEPTRSDVDWGQLVAVVLAIVALLVAAAVISDAARPETSESVAVPATAGSGSSAASLVPGAPLAVASSQGAPANLPGRSSLGLAGPSGAPQTAIGTALVSGWATFYDAPAGHAAAGPLLRSGDWRGRLVTVCAGERCLVTRLSDWCACGDRHGVPTLIDLARVDFARLGSTSRGVLRVIVESAYLPATDTGGAS